MMGEFLNFCDTNIHSLQIPEQFSYESCRPFLSICDFIARMSQIIRISYINFMMKENQFRKGTMRMASDSLNTFFFLHSVKNMTFLTPCSKFHLFPHLILPGNRRLHHRLEELSPRRSIPKLRRYPGESTFL